MSQGLSKATYPRTMTKGVFKGRRFTSFEEYNKALRALRGNGQPSDATEVIIRIGEVTVTLEGPASSVFDVLGRLASKA